MLPDSCKGCKGCCTNMGVNIMLNEEVLFSKDLLETIYLRPDKYPPLGRSFTILKHKENGECIALDNGLCSIYNNRPMICKDFERGSTECLDSIDRLGK